MPMFKSRTAVVMFTGLALAAGSSALLAEPKDRYPQSMPMSHESQGGHGRHDGEHPGQQRHDDRHMPPGEHANRGARDEPRGDSRSGYVHIDSDRIRGVIGDNRSYWSSGPELPPGIRKNLQRGKPLPPGIDRHWLDRRLEHQLPYYEGHEWVRTGNDLLLISISTGLINVVLYDIFH